MATKSKNDPAAVDAYLASLPKDEREALERLRRLIKETVPEVEERISYGTTVRRSKQAGYASPGHPRHVTLTGSSSLTFGDRCRVRFKEKAAKRISPLDNPRHWEHHQIHPARYPRHANNDEPYRYQANSCGSQILADAGPRLEYF